MGITPQPERTDLFDKGSNRPPGVIIGGGTQVLLRGEFYNTVQPQKRNFSGTIKRRDILSLYPAAIETQNNKMLCIHVMADY
ncbi:hypothetical protein JTE90_020125 [Oedothorax gibbosus]|uniref:Uncharacterized protein n=1 Tax=Oedothorax gibbosus TaxID=931172 RepID=A0AAV6VNM7_9ARAC|nr:hypothetical protein JTE90_020125 [Oedothorax gibbosus]